MSYKSKIAAKKNNLTFKGLELGPVLKTWPVAPLVPLIGGLKKVSGSMLESMNSWMVL